MKRNRYVIWLLCLCLLGGARYLPAAPEVWPEALENGIAHNLERVPEFLAVKELAEKHGLRAYLFGGTAASYAHYVKWDLQREAGDTSYFPSRFDYDVSSIFRCNQDIDLAVEGPPDKAAVFERELRTLYPYQYEGRSIWEVRLLKENRGAHEALVGNPSFSNQNTDSSSTGLIEITEPSEGEARIRDLRDADSRHPVFFEDVRTGKLHFYYSDRHTDTARYQAGLNPPILSVIRYFTKVFQYGLKIDPSDVEALKDIIARTDWPALNRNAYVAYWIEKNAKKLVQNAIDLEAAVDTLDEYGLRKHLISLGDPRKKDTLAWWLSKEPLRSKPLGEGDGKTAEELGVTEIAHDTNTLEAYEAISRSPVGLPNAFISRDNAPGETSAFGEGFYTLKGDNGLWGTGYTVRFALNPRARQGTDFLYKPNALLNATQVVVTNRRALRVLPDRLDSDLARFLERVYAAEGGGSAGAAMIVIQGRRVATVISRMTPKEFANVVPLLARLFKHWDSGPAKALAERLKANPLSLEKWRLLAEKLPANNPYVERLLGYTLSRAKDTGEYFAWVNEADSLPMHRGRIPAALWGNGALDAFFNLHPTLDDIKRLHEWAPRSFEGAGLRLALAKQVKRLLASREPVWTHQAWLTATTEQRIEDRFLRGCVVGFGALAVGSVVSGLGYSGYSLLRWLSE